MNEDANESNEQDDCDVHSHPIPASELAAYSVDRDIHSEQDIARYVESQSHGDQIQHVEKIKEELVLGDAYEIWDVTTDEGRWWVITNFTNLYSQQHFPSLDYTLSFHIGLMMRLRSRASGAGADDPTPFDEVFRRQEQAQDRHEQAVEAEDYQAVGLQFRECLLSLVVAVRRRVESNSDVERPQDANFIAWAYLLIAELCAGGSNQQLRSYLKNTAKEAWQLVSWLTHDRNANNTASAIAINACDTVVGYFVRTLVRERIDRAHECPLCKSRDIRTHFDHLIEPDGDYYMTCGVCDWDTHPNGGTNPSGN